jgi:hypothetical protein
VRTDACLKGEAPPLLADAVRLFARRGFDWTGRYTAIAGTAAQLSADAWSIRGDGLVPPVPAYSVEPGEDPYRAGVARAARDAPTLGALEILAWSTAILLAGSRLAEKNLNLREGQR